MDQTYYQALLKDVDARREEWLALEKTLDTKLRRRFRDELRIELNYTSNKIEGSSFSREEVVNLAQDSDGFIESKNSRRQDLYEMVCHDKLIYELLDGRFDNEKQITQTLIKELHRIFKFEPYDEKSRKLIGRWRDHGEKLTNYRLEDIEFTEPEEINAEIEKVINWVNGYWSGGTKDKPRRHPVEVAAKFHYDFVSIHPFFDGNGRISRILTNIILHKFGYLPIIVGEEQRADYGVALADGQSYGKGEQPFFEFVAKRALASFEFAFEAVKEKSGSDSIADRILRLKKQALEIQKKGVIKNTANFQDLLYPSVYDFGYLFSENSQLLDDVFSISEKKIDVLKEGPLVRREIFVVFEEIIDLDNIKAQNLINWGAQKVTFEFNPKRLKTIEIKAIPDFFASSIFVFDFSKDTNYQFTWQTAKSSGEEKIPYNRVLSKDKMKAILETFVNEYLDAYENYLSELQ